MPSGASHPLVAHAADITLAMPTAMAAACQSRMI